MTATTQQSLEEKYKEIVSQANWENVFQRLGLEPKNNGDYLEILCPKCSKRRAFFYPNTDTGEPKIICNRKNECGFESHILKHLNNGTFPKGADWKESVKKLADLAGIPFELNSNFTPRSYPKQKNILLDYWQFLQSRFPGTPAEKYIIENRKLDPSITSFGYFPSEVGEVYGWAKEKGYSEEELLSSFIVKEKNGSRFPAMYGRLAGAFIDQRGNVHNIWGRDLTGKIEGSKKYFNLDNSDVAHKKSPYGAEQFKGGIIVWAEGYLDVIAAKESEIIAVASGTASIPEDMVKSLNGLHTIVIALDKDGAGGKGAFGFIEKNINNENLKMFAINHKLMKGCKDIAELYEKHGKEAVQNVFLPDNLEHAFTFAAEHILSKHKTGETWTPIAKENALSEATLFDKKVVASSKIPLLKDYFWRNGIQKELGLDDSSLDNHIDNLQQKKEKEKLKNQIETYTQSANKKAAEGDLEGASEDVQKLREYINRKQNPYHQIKPYTIFDLEADLENSKEGFKTGYHELDEMVRIHSEAITLIGGRPSHGKTTLMMNIFLNMIISYPDMNFYFFSYEETQQQIALKIINILAGHIINESQNLSQIQGYIKGKHKGIKEIEEAKKIYQSLVESGRLKIVGQPFFVQDLSTTISHLCTKEPIGAIFIDYIQKIKNKERFSTRQLELQKTSEIILETAKDNSIPIILGAQLGRDQNSRDKVRLDNLREAGDLENDANTVLGIFNPSMDKAQQAQEPLMSRTVDITVTPLKNRNGIVNKSVTLKFDRPILKITDKKGN
jgi:replicative DNA helicase